MTNTELRSMILSKIMRYDGLPLPADEIVRLTLSTVALVILRDKDLRFERRVSKATQQGADSIKLAMLEIIAPEVIAHSDKILQALEEGLI